MTHASTARQGHRYKYGDKDVIAMQSGIVVKVREITDTWLGQESTVKASWLKPLPMVYYGGETPQ